MPARATPRALVAWFSGLPLLVALLLGCHDIDSVVEGAGTGDGAEPPHLVSLDPALGDPLGGARITIAGAHLTGATIAIGGAPCTDVETLGEATVRCRAPALPAGVWDVEAATAAGTALLREAYESWSPAELPGARLFDARSGVATEEETTVYEWQRLTAEIAPDWRVRDGNTLTWLPSTGRFWMVGGWNGLQEPDGFSSVPPGLEYPPENTTNEVWSSADGATWDLELAHENDQFERRHVHNTALWKGALWMIGGDAHQGYYNHDVVMSEDGVHWTEVLAPGAPPWEPRALQISGVYDGALWTGGGQSLLGPEEEYVYHNDLWRSEDGVHWTQVAADGPGSDSRWAGCGMTDGFVEFEGRMWLVGCARYREVAGHELSNEVWSTKDGSSWQLHTAPPWAGKGWPNVVVWDGKLWVLFGYTTGDAASGWPAGNANEAWYSEDGEHWDALPADAPVPGSHAQGVAVTDGFLLYAGGNYSFGFGAGFDRSSWRLVPFRGAAVHGWTDRGGDALEIAAPDVAARPVLVADAFGSGEPGLQFDGSRSMLALDGVDAQPDGRTVLWVARAPHLPLPWGWEETYAPIATVVGGADESPYPSSSIGLSGGAVVMVNREEGSGPSGEPLWARVEGGSDLQEGPGQVRLAGMSHAADGTVTTWVDGGPVASSGPASYASPRSWSRVGGSLDGGGYYGPNMRFAGTLGAVVILPRAMDEQTAERIHAWARGRFDVP